MSVTDTTDKTQTENVSFDVDLAHRPEKVWRALTEPALMAEWLLPTFDFGLAPGTIFKLKSEPVGAWDGVVHCRVLEAEAPHRLRYAWVVGDIDTVVAFSLAPTKTGTRLSIVQSGFREHQKQNFGGARYGWRLMGGKLVALLDRAPATAEATR